jgi:NTE family protein
MSARYGVSFDSLPATRSYTLGGFLNISGYQRDSLLASDFVTGRLVYYRELFSAGSPLFGLALFGGGSLELSHIENDDAELADYNDLLSGSLFLGVDTAIAPVYFALGMAEEGEASGYFVLGRVRGN